MKFHETLIFPTGGRSNYRIPSVITTKNGTVLAFCNDRKDTVADHADVSSLVMVRKEPGSTYGEVTELRFREGFTYTIGSAVYDEETDTAMLLASCGAVSLNEFGNYTPEQIAAHRQRAIEKAEAEGIRLGDLILKSTDNGKTWEEHPLIIEGTDYVHSYDGRTLKAFGSTHGSSHGITLRHGKNKGRLLCPSRIGVDRYSNWEDIKHNTYNNAIYSDDHGMTWIGSKPVQMGTGEGTLIELADGTILYNSRAYFKDGKRYLALSHDGGASYGEFCTDDFLLEETRIGCNASFLRVELSELSEKDRALLPNDAEDLTVFCNPRSTARENMTACISFDGAKTWSRTKTIHKGHAGYSGLAYAPATGEFCLLYETGENGPEDLGLVIADFDIEWLLSD